MGKHTDHDPWRKGAVTVTLPTGHVETLALLADPVQDARVHLHRATEMAENGNIIECAVDIYANCVLSHYFEDANRRTAVLAAHYFLKRYGIPVPGLALHELGLGNVREPEQIEALKETIRQMAKFAGKKKK